MHSCVSALINFDTGTGEVGSAMRERLTIKVPLKPKTLPVPAAAPPPVVAASQPPAASLPPPPPSMQLVPAPVAAAAAPTIAVPPASTKKRKAARQPPAAAAVDAAVAPILPLAQPILPMPFAPAAMPEAMPVAAFLPAPTFYAPPTAGVLHCLTTFPGLSVCLHMAKTSAVRVDRQVPSLKAVDNPWPQYNAYRNAGQSAYLLPWVVRTTQRAATVCAVAGCQ